MSESLCHSDEITIVKEHMSYIIGMLVSPDFKQLISWTSLTRENIMLPDGALETLSLRTFIILTAMKI